MGNQRGIQFSAKKLEQKWSLYILLSVTLLSFTASSANIYKTSPANKRKAPLKLGKFRADAVRLSLTANASLSQPGAQLYSRQPLVVSRSMTPPESKKTNLQSDFAPLSDVSVTCARSDMVVRVKAAFYGLGADASELMLGDTCKSNGVLRPYGDLLFTYPLTECDVQRELLPGYLVYKFVLHYDPSPVRFPSKVQPISVNIECRYQRNHYMHHLAIQPTWETAIAHKRLKASQTNFQIQLMDDMWNNPVKSRVFQLGQTVNFQISAPHLPPGRKLYINSCYASPSSHSKSHIKFAIIDKYGCLLDSKIDPGASKFISRTDKSLKFFIKAFQFIIDPDAEINMHCQLYVTSAEPSPAHKSCTYRQNRWEALSGDHAICECCDSQCVTSKPRRAMMDGFTSSRSLLLSTTNSLVNMSIMDEWHNETEKQTKEHLEESVLTGIIRQKQGRSEVKVSKTSEEALKWHGYYQKKKTVRLDGREGDPLDLNRVNYTERRLAYKGIKVKPALKEKGTPLLDCQGEKGKQKCADGSVKDVIREVLKENWENSDEIGDVLDEKNTWYFTWS